MGCGERYSPSYVLEQSNHASHPSDPKRSYMSADGCVFDAVELFQLHILCKFVLSCLHCRTYVQRSICV